MGSMSRGWPAVFIQWFVNDFYPWVLSGVERVLKWALECCRQRGSMDRGEPVVFYTVVCERYLTLLFRGRECVLMRGPGMLLLSVEH